MAELYQTSRSNVVEHIKHIFEEGELAEDATCRKFRQVQTEGGGNYWKELLDRIRDIRSSEKVLYRQVLDLYATAMDYDPKTQCPAQTIPILPGQTAYF
jgi:hypothetical protein